jgi:hypothetical protein
MKKKESKARIFISPPKAINASPKNTILIVAIVVKMDAGIVLMDLTRKQEDLKKTTHKA